MKQTSEVVSHCFMYLQGYLCTPWGKRRLWWALKRPSQAEWLGSKSRAGGS